LRYIMGEHPAQIDQWLDIVFAYGPFWVYAALFTACFLENITPPFPGDSFILASGALVSTGRLEAAPAFAVCVVGVMLSVMVWYWAGRRFGREYLIRKDFKFFSAEDLYRSERLFARWGPLILIASRFVVGFRVAIALVAGLGRVGAGSMVVFSSISYMLFVSVLMYLGYVAAENMGVIEHYFRTYKTIAWPVVILIVGYWAVRKFISIRKRHNERGRIGRR